MTKPINKGSEWRKWDLHLHSPFTKLSDNFKKIDDIDLWETYSKKIEESDVSVFGITDYFCCENYFTFLDYYNQKYPDSEKVFFLNIEFRLDISVNKSGEEINIHVIFSNEIEKNRIDNFLTILKTNHTNEGGARVSCKNLNQSQFISATINHNDLVQSLNEVFGSHKPYIILAAANNAGLRPVKDSPRKLSITDEIDKICDAFFGGRQNVEYYLKFDRYETNEISKPKPVLSGSDCHSFEDLDSFLGKYVERQNPQTNNIEIYKDVTWIKSDTTFEGLKQVLFEPEFRIKISEQKPREPIRKIESITFNFPTNTYIKRNSSNDKQEFCLNNLKTDICFSPYFTCLIGGRGTGKSTIINLLGERLGEKTDFFKDNNLIINNAKYVIETDVNKIINISGTNEIEFVSQGKIERLAEGNELTKLIFNERIKEVESGFYSLDTEIDSITETINETIKLLFDLSKNQSSLKTKNKERETTQNIIDSVNDERYKEITDKINNTRKEINSIKSSQTKYENILSTLRNLLIENALLEPTNEIDIRINEVITLLRSITEFNIQEDDILINLKEFEETKAKIITLNQDFIIQNQNLKEFFQEKGMSEETIKDSQKANENLAQINSEILMLENNNKRLLTTFKENKIRIDDLLKLNKSYNELIAKNIFIINKKLEVNNENVLNINFTFEFDNLEFKNSLFSEFYDTFSKYHIPNTTISRVMEVLYLVEPDIDLLNSDYRSFISKIDSELEFRGYTKSNNYVKTITDIFSLNINYQIYKLLIKKHLFNLSNYIKIKGYYGERELQNCSFGQRCTAVIVTLLMTGVKPLVIDEPEAHLDNRLVADYLVNLIKNKKLDRQIIFATHNSNFVINGDSELIHILDIPLNHIFTNITSTSIENISNRDKLLKLEGGRDAFMIREQKYGIHN